VDLRGRWLPLTGAVLVGAVPLLWHFKMVRAERAAADLVSEISLAQHRFNETGMSGYATDLVSLITPCAGRSGAALRAIADAQGYELALRPARAAQPVARDCHGRPTASDFYVSARPRLPGRDGRRAFAATSNGRVFVFFDGVPPSERDMEPGGLAVPLDRIEMFKIP
jgi:hypothetical protein